MSTSSSWIHGNALTIETPIRYNPSGEEIGRLNFTPRGFGAFVSGSGGESSWLHLPIPTVNPLVKEFEVIGLSRVFLLYDCVECSIRNVHIYDGNKPVQKFDELSLDGSPLIPEAVQPGHSHSRNTFLVNPPREVRKGVCLSFFLTVHIPVNLICK